MSKFNNISKTKIPPTQNPPIKSINLTEALKKAKEKDQDATLALINKYSPLVDKYSRIYKLKDYEKSDLQQEGNIAIINAINKFDLSKDPNVFDGYAINSIRNKYGTLARTHVKRNTESSLNISTNNEDSSEIINLIQDTIDIEKSYITSEQLSRLQLAINTLSKEELELINTVYIKKSHSLLKYCKENNLTYHTSRMKLKKSLEKLKLSLQ
ncbi:RNA polymerase factor sigma-70 [uncultured Clostridium sp.]|uniref:sigma-70 family RNA polymerase sigma factor n=1 Tax=uncultured Clostridium sp. TaxID=59620 RepID=UPI00082222CB|nr:sigma-70 family RNA polymerase sigma factor [uncultured Clostridium sp.]SCJ36640.1 RNA polymerase factor sigma-70 [uncultured Clostridium sp.]